GLAPESVSISEEKLASAEFEQGLSRLNEAVAEARAINARERGEFAGALEVCSRALEGLSLDNFPARFGAIQGAIESMKSCRRRNGLAEALKAVKRAAMGNGNGQPGLRDCYAGWAMIPFERAFRGLLVALRDRHRMELDRRGSLDFSELLIRTRDLLRHQPVTRREVQARIGALLVDEFQDTNRLQLEIVLLLAERRQGRPPAMSTGRPGRGGAVEPPPRCAGGGRKKTNYQRSSVE